MHASHARLGLGVLLIAAVSVGLAVVGILGAFDSARADTSGPNASGYVWIDSNAPDPTVTFDWVDATGGTLSDVEDEDDDWETATIPFTFNFFGTDYTQVDISSNGFLSFDIDNDCNDNYNEDPDEFGYPVPPGNTDCDDAEWGGWPLIAPWFDDLDPSYCGNPYYDTQGTAPNRMFIVEFNDVCHHDCDECEAGEGITFETILFETSNDIKIQYQDVVFTDDPGDDPDLVEEDNGGSASTGIDKDGLVGLGYSWAGTPPLTDGLAVLYTQGTVDLSITKTASSSDVIVGDEVTFTVEVTNNGQVDAANVVVADDLPDGLEFVSASQGCSEAGGTVTCSLGTLAAGSSATVEIVVNVSGEGAITNTATVSSDQTNVGTGSAEAVLSVGGAPTPTPTATPAELPDTGTPPANGSDFPWLLTVVTGLAAMALGGFWVARRVTGR